MAPFHGRFGVLAGRSDVSGKPDVPRRAVASGEIVLQRHTIEAIRGGTIEKGEVLESAKVAALHAAKPVSVALPYTHPIPITATPLLLDANDSPLVVTVEGMATDNSGVEQEAMAA